VEDLGVDEEAVETREFEKTRGQGEGRQGDRARSEERGATGRDTVELKYPTKIRLKQKDESHIP